MKTILYNSIAIAFCLTILSCNNNNESKESNFNSIESTLNNIPVDPEAKGGNQCLLNYQTKYDQLLSEEDVLKVTGFDKNKLTKEYIKPLDDPKYHIYYMGFDNGRKEKSPISGTLLDQEDIVKVQYIEEMSLNSFQYNYKVPTDEETQETQEVLADVVDDKIENEDAQKLVKKAEEQNISKEEIKKTGSSLISAFSEINKAIVKVENLGDAAVWNTKNMELYILQNGVKFGVTANVSDDVERNKEVAISLAKIILDKCK